MDLNSIMNIEFDRQQNRTLSAIRAAFIELLFEKGFQKLNMAMVALHANIGRSTLYAHFHSKNDLLRDALIMPMSALSSVIASRDVPSHLSWWLNHFKENQAIARVLFYLPARQEMIDVLAEQINKRLEENIENPEFLAIGSWLLSRQIAAAQFELLIPWIMGQIAIKSENLAHALHASSNGLLDAILIKRST